VQQNDERACDIPCCRRTQAQGEETRGRTLLDRLASPPAHSLLQQISSPVNLVETNVSKGLILSCKSTLDQTSPISKRSNKVSVSSAKNDFQSKKDKPYSRNSSEGLIKGSKEMEIEVKDMREKEETDLLNNFLARRLGIIEGEKPKMKKREMENLRIGGQPILGLGRKSKKTRGEKELGKRSFLGSKKLKEQNRHSPSASKKPEIPQEGMSVKLLSGLEMPRVVPGISLNWNGAISSEGTLLISMLSTVVSMLSDLCCTTLQNLVNSKSTTQKLSPLCGLKQRASGTPPGHRPLK
jgi:hypothetical protein